MLDGAGLATRHEATVEERMASLYIPAKKRHMHGLHKSVTIASSVGRHELLPAVAPARVTLESRSLLPLPY